MYDVLAKKIPDKVRSLRLMVETDPIDKARAVGSNIHMQLLFAIYTEFVFPGKEEDIDCWKCLQRILNCFHEMKPYLVTLEKEYNLLQLVK